MEGMSIPYHDAISIGEDNSAAKIIAHAGKLTRIVTKTQALQENVRHGRVHFTWVSSAHNLADHFTKALPYSTLRAHCMTVMGYQFIDAGHRAVATLAWPDKSVL
jgi:nicotinamidase-related amidase